MFTWFHRKASQQDSATIVIPLLAQNPGYLRQCLESAVNQTVHCEVIVVTEGELPHSNSKILAEFAQSIRVITQSRPGFPAAINEGFSLAAADRIGLLLSDDWLSYDAVECTLKYQADIVSTGTIVYKMDGDTAVEYLRKTRNAKEYAQLEEDERRAKYLSHFFLFARSAIKKSVGLDETLGQSPGIDDYDFIWTLLEQGATVGICEKYLYHYRDHSGPRLTLSPKEEMIQTMQKILEKHHVPPEKAKALLDKKKRWFGEPPYKILEKSN